MIRTSRRRGGLFLASVALLLAGCTTADDGTETTGEVGGTTTGVDTGATTGALDLAQACPDPIVIQTDWFPEAEHGGSYQLVGDDYSVDVDDQTVTGSLTLGGADLGIDVQIRTGGPAIGDQPVSTQMYTDLDITLGFVSTDEAVAFADDAPTIAVLAPLEKNPQIIMWDPATYPDVQTIDDLGTEGVTVNVFPGGTFPDVLVSLGLLSADQIDPSYTGGPSAFIAADGAIAQQGFVSAEPYNYEFVFEEWAKPVAFQLIHDAGFQVYAQAIAIRAGDLGTLAGCLERFVPVMQQATVDYANNPERVNAMVIDAVAQFDDFWVYDQGVADYAVETQVAVGVIGNGADSTLGNMDPTRVQTVIDQMTGAGMDVRSGLTAEDIATNQFIDESIGLG